MGSAEVFKMTYGGTKQLGHSKMHKQENFGYDVNRGNNKPRAAGDEFQSLNSDSALSNSEVSVSSSFTTRSLRSLPAHIRRKGRSYSGHIYIFNQVPRELLAVPMWLTAEDGVLLVMYVHSGGASICLARRLGKPEVNTEQEFGAGSKAPPTPQFLT